MGGSPSRIAASLVGLAKFGASAGVAIAAAALQAGQSSPCASLSGWPQWEHRALDMARPPRRMFHPCWRLYHGKTRNDAASGGFLGKIRGSLPGTEESPCQYMIGPVWKRAFSTIFTD